MTILQPIDNTEPIKTKKFTTMSVPNTYSRSEVGHAKNVANFQDLIEVCQSFGVTYNPSNPNLSIASLQSKYDEADAAILNAHTQRGGHILAINERQKAFENLPQIASQIGYALTAMTNDQRIVDDAKTFIKKIRGYASKVKTNDNEEGQEIKEPKSNSQVSFDKRVDHLVGLIELLKQIPDYNPNESHLTIAGLETYLQDLKDTNKEVYVKYSPYSIAQDKRDRILYDKVDGLTTIAQLVKNYIKSVFGFRSPEFARVKALEFRRQRK